MRKVVFILLLIPLFCFSQTQKDELGFDYEKINGHKVLSPTWDNIFNTITMPPNIFQQLMDKYNYKEEGKNGYVKQNGAGQPLISIKQDFGEIIFIWTMCSLSTWELKQKFHSHYIGYENGVKIYSLKRNDMSVILRIKDEGKEGGFVMFQMF